MKSLSELYSTHQGKVSDKWGIYLPTYDRLFSPYRAQPVRLLEVGVQNGGSLEIWSKYFVQAQKLIGCDINPACSALQYEDPRVAIVVGDANTDAAEHQITSHAQQFDIVIDDGSHRSSDIIKTFVRYFPKVVDGGIFVAEDLHCSYWQEFEGGLHDPYSSMSFFKLLADVVNHEHWGTPQKRVDLTQGIQKRYGVTLNEEILSCIHSVEFVNSICVIRKQEYSCNQLGKRIVTGQLALVSDHGQIVANQHSVALDQSQNYWSKISHPPGELVKEYESSITERDRQIASLNQTVTERDRQIASLNQAVEALRNSTSWRITAPLRFIVHQVKRAKYVASVFPAVVRQAGGVRSTSAKVWRVLQREGIQGLRFRWRAYHSSESSSAPAGRNDYQEWIRRYDTLDDDRRRQMRDAVQHWQSPPLISVVMPTYNADPLWLRRCIESVRAQSYLNWELCIADDCSRQPHVRRVLQEYERTDTRIRVVYRAENGHISRASNSALEIAQGEFVALLDHDDELPKDALYFVVEAINKHPSAKILYSDEDKIDKDGRRFDPHFKSDWNPDLLYSQNYVSHLGVYRRDLLKTIGGFRPGFEGSQDHDLLLRCLPHVKAGEIIHIPRVLYHWRAIEGSTALAASEKTYTSDASIRALRDYFSTQGIAGIEVQAGLVPNTYRVRWPIPEPAPLVSLLIPTRDKKSITEVAVRSILDKTTYQNYEVLILDNGSVEKETLDWFMEIQNRDARVRVLRYDHPFNFSAINNFGVRHAAGSIIGLINNDIEVISPDWLTEMVSHAIRPEIGCVGAKLYYPDGRVQHAGVIVSLRGVAGHSHKYYERDSSGYFHRLKLTQNVSAVTAACLLVRREVYELVDGLDERELTVAFNDVDFCLKVREAGYRNLWTPYAELYHHESISRGYEDTPEKQRRFQHEIATMKRRWGRQLEEDPYYNPNLTKDREDFSIGLI